jgi:GNAT superfamily N-acetyltransferase
MPELRSYLKHELPRDIAVQIASYVRMQWPGLLGRKTPLWESTPYPREGRHFVLMEDDVLVSHALAHRRAVEHKGETWQVGALSSVFTYPTHRGSGFGATVVGAATDYLRREQIDLALLFCGERVAPMYVRAGWEIVESAQILCGDPSAPSRETCITMGIFLNAKGQVARSALQREPIYVGRHTW